MEHFNLREAEKLQVMGERTTRDKPRQMMCSLLVQLE